MAPDRVSVRFSGTKVKRPFCHGGRVYQEPVPGELEKLSPDLLLTSWGASLPLKLQSPSSRESWCSGPSRHRPACTRLPLRTACWAVFLKNPHSTPEGQWYLGCGRAGICPCAGLLSRGSGILEGQSREALAAACYRAGVPFCTKLCSQSIHLNVRTVSENVGDKGPLRSP